MNGIKTLIIACAMALFFAAGAERTAAYQSSCGPNAKIDYNTDSCMCLDGYVLNDYGTACEPVSKNYYKKTKIGGKTYESRTPVEKKNEEEQAIDSESGYLSGNLKIVYLDNLSPGEAKNTIDSLKIPDLLISFPMPGDATEPSFGGFSSRNCVILRGGQSSIEMATRVLEELDTPLKIISFQVTTVDVDEDYLNTLTMSLLPGLTDEGHAKIVAYQKLNILDGKRGLISLKNDKARFADSSISDISIEMEAHITSGNSITIKAVPLITKTSIDKNGHRETKLTTMLNAGVELVTLGVFSMKKEPRIISETSTMETVITAVPGEEVILGVTGYDRVEYKNEHGYQRLAKSKDKVMEKRKIAVIIVPQIRDKNEDRGYIKDNDKVEKNLNDERYY